MTWISYLCCPFFEQRIFGFYVFQKKVKINFVDMKKVSTFAVPNETGRSGGFKN